MDITLTVSKSEILQEVAQTTGYVGAKMDDDENAYERISTVDEDNSELQRFWNESRAELAKAFIRVLESEGMQSDDTYSLVLNVSVSFDVALVEGMQLGLYSFFVQNITAKWFVFTNKKEAGDYADKAAEILAEIREKAHFKKKPTRPTYNNN